MICGVIFLEKEVVNMKKIYMPDGGKILKQESHINCHKLYALLTSQILQPEGYCDMQEARPPGHGGLDSTTNTATATCCSEEIGSW